MNAWQLKRVSDLGEIVTGRTPSTKRKDFYNGHFNLISPADLDNGRYVKTAHRRLTKLGFEQCRALPKNTVLVGCIGNVGKLGMVGDDCSATNQQINALICNSNNDPDFIYYCFYANKERLEQAAVKTTVPILNKANFGNFTLNVPPLPEQKKIAYVLSTVQRAIEAQDRLIQTTTELKKALMHKLFTEGTRGEPQKQTEIGPVPESWEVVELGRFAQFKNGINFTKNQKGDKGVLTIDVLNMYGHNCTASLENLYRVNKQVSSDYLLKAGDLLFVRSSLKLEGVGWTSLFDGCSEPATFCGFIIRARLNDSEIFCPRFLTNYFRTDTARKILISGGARVAITNINQGMLKSFPIPKPSLTEQQHITSTINNIDYKIDQHRKKRTALQDLFRVLLHELMTANIRVDGMS